jgi:folate-binding Fe-S cluster repair protein YgfZ
MLVALRHEVGAITMGRDVIRVSGPDAVGYLQGQCSQDVDAMEIGTSADALLLSPQGKLDALVRVTRTGEDELHLDVDAGFGAAVIARLARFKLRVRVDIEALPWTAVALRGPGAAAVGGRRHVVGDVVRGALCLGRRDRCGPRRARASDTGWHPSLR